MGGFEEEGDTIRDGGFRATSFVFVLSTLENVGFITNMVTLVLYFFLVMHFDLAGSATTVTNFLGTSFLLTLVGGFISDTYMNRLNTILLFGFIEVVGYILVIIQAYYKSLRPEAGCMICGLEGKNKLLFYASFYILALGYGGVRGVLPSIGGDQFDLNDPKEKRQQASYFNWLLMSATLGACFGVTIIVWISTNKSWPLGFLISMSLAIVGFVVVSLGKPFYRVRIPGASPLLRILQVFVVAIRNRNLRTPLSHKELYEVDENEYKLLSPYANANANAYEKVQHTKSLGFLDKAAILPAVAADGTTTTRAQPWHVCTVTQVEEVKLLIRMLPILLSTVFLNTCMAQLQTFSIQQGNIMNLHLGSFKVPAGSIPVIPLLFMTVLVPVYELLFVPLARRITGHPTGISHLKRVGVGLVLCAISMSLAAIIEVKRRNALNHRGEQISFMWLAFQYGVFGIADLFTLTGLMNFFYTEAVPGMRSLSTSFTWLSISFGYYLSTIFVNIINSVTHKVTKSKKGWLYGHDLNRNRLDLFYWFMAVVSCINFAAYLLCAKWYKYRMKHHLSSDLNIDNTDNNNGGAPQGNAGSNNNDGKEEKEKEKDVCITPAGTPSGSYASTPVMERRQLLR